MNLKTLKAKYLGSRITKEEYIREMHKIHKLLFDYAGFIKDTDIAEIEIIDGKVAMTTRINGIKMVVDTQDERVIPIEILNFGSYEQAYVDAMCRFIKPGFVVFDIGANVGWFTLNIAKSVRDVRIYSFEPIPKTFKQLEENLRLNGVTNVRVFNFGLYNEEKELVFYFDPKLSGNAASKNLRDIKDIKKIRCKVRKIDNFIKEKKIKVDFIKCDVEGAELFVIQGGLSSIKRDKPIIFVEMLRKWSAPFGYHPNDIISLLRSLGYRCFVIKKGRLFQFDKMDEKTLQTNFFFLHAVKHSAVIHHFS